MRTAACGKRCPGRGRAGARLALLALLLLGLLGVERPPGLGDVVEVRHWSYPDYTRVVIEVDRPVEIKQALSPGEIKARLKNRR